MNGTTKWNRGFRGLRGFLVALVAVSVGGCSVFTSTTPRDGMQVARYGVDAKGRQAKQDEMRMSNEWMQAEYVENRVEEEFWDPAEAGAPGTNSLKTRKVLTIRRNVDPERAAETAQVKAQATLETADVLGLLVETVGPAVMAGIVSIRNTQEENRTMRREIEALRDVELKKLEPEPHHEAPAEPAAPVPTAE
jgi:hypothetical protein